MLASNENIEIRNRLADFDKRIEDMHLEFYKYYTGEERRLPDMQKFEREILVFSRKKIIDLELSKNLDSLLFKFQNRKKIWLSWVEEIRHKPKKEEKTA
jgi:hypothetical protein